VSYGIRFEGNALAQLHRFPPAALDALLDRVVLLVDAPWDAYVAAPGDDPTLRETTFGSGHGMVAFRVDDDHELIRIFAITWLG
jgi:hypothetical protein